MRIFELIAGYAAVIGFGLFALCIVPLDALGQMIGLVFIALMGGLYLYIATYQKKKQSNSDNKTKEE